jgi:lincosamide nucleotidyltransferase A/C/D/E
MEEFTPEASLTTHMKARTSRSEMTAESALQLYRLFDRHGIKVWIDGGWGVDALLCRQTRKHDDLDIALHHSNLSALCVLLEDCGYRHVPSGGSWGCNFVLADDQGHRIDIHSFEIDPNGENTFGVAYRGEHLTGLGTIGDCRVRCVAPEWMVKFHTGYPLDRSDFLDVKALCEKFEIELPQEHQRYWQPLAQNNIRSATKNDWDEIREIHRIAFGRPAEAKLVEDLRQSGDVVISLVAERGHGIIGHVLFSKLEAPMKALGLAPVAVQPSFQKQGIGSALIREGLHRAREDRWEGVFVLGDPAYYGRFGFRVDAATGYSSPYSGDHFMIVSFGDIPKVGRISYPESFKLLDSPS